ncbi:uncharacterized protein Z520_07617 [Fonsecaea multimorphosa CBS 102226]|uniref:Microbial-type PARG catalytic domain-containing protein n=1 Tax=Fonsecaea multimorphosa CBS 102226 TaxID=1442371 RepID=A0A0D2JTV4_9EURO|nr:uncharacterized protein Z520_07617 [Fonsecaea multimorphosa CBS 102226]KIX96897.1 hypothetical protein Z520_07617 [Fonsecaea multimorphosa CBS 102226]OAL22573.1 hypothetical protein AYO22_07131 [Fonsecaea multimorphosa]
MGITQEQSQSTFFPSQLEPLDHNASPGHTYTNIKVRYGDTFSLTRQLLKSRPDYVHKTAVLKCASDAELAGGWRHRFGTTQEDALCYSSTLGPTLDQWREKYPWRTVVQRDRNNPGECAGVFSPQVVIFRDEISGNCETLPKKD